MVLFSAFVSSSYCLQREGVYKATAIVKNDKLHVDSASPILTTERGWISLVPRPSREVGQSGWREVAKVTVEKNNSYASRRLLLGYFLAVATYYL